LGIENLLDKRTYEVSGDQAQRTAIERALINNPTLVLADEPTGNLDSVSARDVMEYLEKINKEEKVTTMMVTHDPLAAYSISPYFHYFTLYLFHYMLIQ